MKIKREWYKNDSIYYLTRPTTFIDVTRLDVCWDGLISVYYSAKPKGSRAYTKSAYV